MHTPQLLLKPLESIIDSAALDIRGLHRDRLGIFAQGSLLLLE
jgi:hypothetical protein